MARRHADTAPRPSAARRRRPRPASRSRPDPRPCPRQRARRPSRLAGTARAGIDRGVRPGSASRAATAASNPASPVTCSTRTFATSRGSASATARLKRRTACEPPKISSSRSFAATPSRTLAAPRSIAPAFADRRAGHEARLPPAEGPAGLPEADRQASGEPCRPADAASRHDVAVPHDHRDAQDPRRRSTGTAT